MSFKALQVKMQRTGVPTGYQKTGRGTQCAPLEAGRINEVASLGLQRY